MSEPDDAALLAAIRETPGDDLPRLAYADHLDEQPATETCKACRGAGIASFHSEAEALVGMSKACIEWAEAAP